MKIEIKTPYDPNFQFFTSGDDFSKYARLWTRGYDVYTPNRNIVAHDDQNKMFSSIPKANNEVDALEWRDNGMTDLYRDDTKENAKDSVYTDAFLTESSVQNLPPLRLRFTGLLT